MLFSVIDCAPLAPLVLQAGQIAPQRIDSKEVEPDVRDVMDDGDLPRPKGDAASKLASEDLSPYSQDELDERIALLEAEIARVSDHKSRAAAHMQAADALFRKPGT